MKRVDDRVFVSPTDLAYFLACPHRTALEMAEAAGVIRRPAWDDPLLEALFALGLAHERQYVDSLQARARTLVDLADVRDRREAVTRTLEAMRRGVEVIVQAALAHEAWYGRPDVLVRRPEPSLRLGAWSYEVADTKLARETRGGTILQLGLYCELLEAAQGRAPERFFVVTPGDDGVLQVVRAYRVEDYAAYFRLLRRRLLEAVEAGHERLAAAHYPEPVDHCDICAWSPICRDRRRRDDHLSLVAGISRLQRHTLEAHDVSTVEALATVADPLPFRPNRGSIEAYRRVRDRPGCRSRPAARVASPTS